jgi:ABC-type branched-subunit amino acid transport system substrate-binding protein
VRLAVTVLTACALWATAAGGATAPAPITLGAVFSLTGGGGVYGPQQLRGARLAVAQINAAGGIDGHPLRLVPIDGASTPAVGAAAMRRLVEAGALAILGPTLSLVAVAAAWA